MVGHAIREVESALRDVLQSSLSVPTAGTHQAEIRALLAALNIAEEDPAAQAWLAIPEGELGSPGWAHRHHLGVRAPDEAFGQSWERAQLFLDVVLASFEPLAVRAYGLLERLIAADPPTGAGVRAFLDELPKYTVLLDEFADRAPLSWMAPLAEAGYLLAAPTRRDLGEGDTDEILRWPLCRLVIRAAASADHAEKAAEIATALGELDNPYVHLDVAAAALQLPPNLASGIARFGAPWLEANPSALMADRITELASMLADGGEADAAFGLTALLLEMTVEAE